uniref:Uncharacterized protein n=1 Tax=Anguilla anguilla TaxID=7936 RepID=A0A0E9RLJ9_ANGAN
MFSSSSCNGAFYYLCFIASSLLGCSRQTTIVASVVFSSHFYLSFSSKCFS